MNPPVAQKSKIEITLKDGLYHLRASGQFGGGYNHTVTKEKLFEAVKRAFEMYGANPLGCEICGDINELPDDIREKIKGLDDEKTCFSI